MVIVERAMLAPAMCMLRKTAEGPFIDLLREFDFDHEGRMYLSVAAARELGVFAGLPSQDSVDAAREAERGLREQVARLERENEELRQFKDAAEYTLHALGTKVRQKPGPKKQTVAA